ncbi:MAG: Cys-tRNA(Pro) deacylase [Lachnospiraceae bacterium]|nr:Cys-tRNA(Pro) deacylase [Lachnospiraceae bacterium]
MSKEKEVKTNVMRLLDKAKISYRHMEYEVDENDLSGTHAADVMGVQHEILFKTLVLHGDKTGYLVCVIPVDDEVDLKKTAKISGNKKVEMLPMKELLPLTGYIRGGCSPIGMKKQFPTYIHESAEALVEIGVSAGQRGQQVMLSPNELAKYIRAQFADITVS